MKNLPVHLFFIFIMLGTPMCILAQKVVTGNPNKLDQQFVPISGSVFNKKTIALMNEAQNSLEVSDYEEAPRVGNKLNSLDEQYIPKGNRLFIAKPEERSIDSE
ncbi:MAG: hypothetical protein ACHQRM_10570 [Bacteroidia bacterium]